MRTKNVRNLSKKLFVIGTIFVLLVGLIAPAAIVAAENDQPSDADKTIKLDPSYQQEPFEGWGTALVWFANVTGGWPDQVRNELADALYGEDGLNFNIARYNIGGGNAPETEPYLRPGADVPGYWNRPEEFGPPADADDSWEEQEGWWDPTNPDHWNWNADANQQWWLQAAKNRGADIFEAFSNSAPYFMTQSGYVSGNIDSWDDNLQADQYENFSTYLTSVVEYLKNDLNIDIRTLSPVNEPNTGYWGADGTQEGSNWAPASQAKIINEVSEDLGELNLDTVVSAMDETNPNKYRNNWSQYDAATKANIGQMNVHTYWPGERTSVRDLAKAEEKRLWMSEVDLGGSVPQDFDSIEPGLDLAERITSDITNLEPRAWVMWQAVENETNMNADNENSNWGLIQVPFEPEDASEVEIKKNKKYYTMGNYTKFIRPGYQMINSNDANTLAAIDKDNGKIVVVYTNQSDAPQQIDFDLSGFASVGQSASATPYVTSAAENIAQHDNIAVNNNRLSTTVAAKSVTTFVINDVSGVNPDETLIDSDLEYKIVNKNSNKVMDLNDNGTSVVQNANAHEEGNQKWTIAKLTNGYSNTEKYKIVNAATGKVLTNNNGSAVVAADQGDETQQWILSTNGTGEFTFINGSSGTLLEVGGQSKQDGASVGLWQANSGTNQAWRLIQSGITEIAPVNIWTVPDMLPELPSQVTVSYGDGSTSVKDVDWDSIDSADYATETQFTVEGSVAGTSIKATAVITVSDIASIHDRKVKTISGVAPILPETVVAVTNLDTTVELPVTWEEIDPALYADLGQFTVTGTLAETSMEAKAYVQVTERGLENVALNTDGSAYPKASASFTGQWDNVNNLNDGVVTGDARWTNWESNNWRENEWVQIDFGEDETISQVKFVFYDDNGGTRPPESLNLEYLDGTEWKTIENTQTNINGEDEAVIDFDAVTTSKVRANLTAMADTCIAMREMEVMGIGDVPSVSSDATLESILVNGEALENFEADTFAYEVELEQTTVPTIAVELSNMFASYDINLPTSVPGTATITVTSEDETAEHTYEISFTVRDDSSEDQYTGVPVGQTWYDTDGNPIQAHGGGFLEHNGWYYWVGEDKSDNSHNTHGINLYRSKDLLNWEFVSTILSDITNPGENTEGSPGLVDTETGNFNMERPKLIYDEDSGKFVLYIHWENGEGYTASQLLIASADTVDGHYTIHHNYHPGGYTSRDFTVYQDPDSGKGYLVSTQDGSNMRLYPLTEDSTDVDADNSYLLFSGAKREAPALIKNNGVYYIVTSGQSGWYPNQAMYSYSTDITNPDSWSALEPVGNNTTFYSQPTNIMEVDAADGTTQYVYMGDHWNPSALGTSTYVWLPLSIDSEKHTMEMEYTPGWSLDSDTGKIELPDLTNVSEGKPVEGEDNVVAGKLLEYITDGEFFESDTWSPDTKYYQQNKVPWSATIDLENVYDLARVDLSFKQFNGSEAYYQYTIQGSNDNENWTVLADESTNMQTGFKTNDLTGKYQYVKINVTAVKNAHNNNSTADWENGLLEMQVYANDLNEEITALPVANKEGKTYTSEQSVTLSSPTAGAELYYTIDGTEPTDQSNRYEGPISIGLGETTLKAVAYAEGMASSGVMTEKYTIISPDTIVSVSGPTEFAVTADEAASGLPETLEAQNAAGETVDASVQWNTDDIQFSAYHSVVVTGTLTGGFEVQATVDVVDQDTIYFIHGAATDDPFFEAAKEKLGSQLRNTVPDQAYDGEWGYTGVIGTDIGTRGSSSTNIYDSGWWAYGNKSIDYTIHLQSGEYTLVSGYKEWWGATRNMQFSAKDSDGNALASVDFTTNGNTVAHQEEISFTLEEAEDVQVSVSKLGGSDPVLAWLAVEKTSFADKSALEQLIQSAQAMKDAGKQNYTDDSWSAFIEKLETAQAVNAERHASQSEVESAHAALQTAVDGLVENDDQGEGGDQGEDGDQGEGGDQGEDDDNLHVTASLGTAVKVYPNGTVSVTGTSVKVILPADLPEGTTVTVNKAKPSNTNGQGLAVAGDVYTFEFHFPAGHESYTGKFLLTLGYDDDKYEAEDVAIYYFNESTDKWEYQGGKAENGTLTLEVNHFSTYGVFAEDQEKQSDENDELPDTATNLYNYLLLGFILIVIGGASMMFARKARKE
ncbi:glycoside hydrolase [Radiobacillus sp. PE A8.2]|uniref:glycoside hydrolase n=1 Tax=Radiobacillus sp. PE A8.2 TaxID=3380349 RepID=UPI00388F0665